MANLFQLVTMGLEEAARSADGAPRAALQAAARQVQALGRMHGLNGRQHSPEGCGDQVRSLGVLLDTLLLRPRGHALVVDVAPDVAELPLAAEVARCLELVIVEAVVNAAKHAFSAGPGGRVCVRLRRDAAQLACTVADDGHGDTGGVGRSGSRGMELIDALAREAGGQCQWVFSRSGTLVRVLLPMAAGGVNLAAPGGTERSQRTQEATR